VDPARIVTRGIASFVRRHPVLIGGMCAAGVFLAGAALSGSLSPLARRPLLDGLSAPPPYNYVNPPAGAQSRRQPASGTFDAALTAAGSKADVFATGDVQFTLVAERGMAPPNDDDARVVLEAKPLDPATTGPLPDDLEPQGNVYRLSARYDPSERGLRGFSAPSQVILAYPAQPAHQKHMLLFSNDGRQWEPLKSTDVPNLQQVGADIEAPGYVVVAAPPPVGIAPSPTEGGGGIPVVVWVVIGSVVLIGLGLATRFLSRGGANASTPPD
jgi:hypothetical protein